MFGYVKVDKPEMKVREYEAYRALYCSLCKAMKKHFGVLASFTLSYDITFLLLARLSFLGCIPSFRKGRCQYNPTKKCNYCNNSDEELKYAAAVSVMLTYFKIKDNISDGSFFKRFLMYLILPLVSFKYKKAKKMYNEVALIIGECMRKQAETESKKSVITDEAAHSSADALGKIISYGLTDENRDIYKFGYGIGKWVYLIDALDDLQNDIKDGSYNVFVIKYNLKTVDDVTKEIKESILATINMSHAYSIEAWERIKLKSLSPIMENVLYNGITLTMNNVFERKKK